MNGWMDADDDVVHSSSIHLSIHSAIPLSPFPPWCPNQHRPNISLSPHSHSFIHSYFPLVLQCATLFLNKQASIQFIHSYWMDQQTNWCLAMVFVGNQPIGPQQTHKSLCHGCRHRPAAQLQFLFLIVAKKCKFPF